MAEKAYPVQIKHFPALNGGHVVTDGILVMIDGKEEYLEGELSIASAMPSEIDDINGRLRASVSPDRIKPGDAVMAIHVRSPAGFRGASYVISSLIVCFNALGFEPQGNTSGHADFAQSLISGAEALKGN
jgi:hypothetical protein